MNRDKMLEAMMKAVTDAVVDVNVEEILAKVYPQIDEKIHETYGFLPEVHEVRTPTATHKSAALRMKSLTKFLTSSIWISLFI